MARASFVRVRAGATEPLAVPVDEVAATELCPVRGRVLRGEVHDDNAFLLGGVAGHAGLFASAADVEAFATATWRAWQGERAGPLDPGVVRAFLAYPPAQGGTHVLGFDTPSATGSSAGSRHPPRLVGHLGFTGASFWLDLDSGVAVVLLTNRVHPTRTNARIQAFRPALHDAVWTSLGVPPV
jgi:CubicO group peptidase (beta-lactamase class C family)